MRVIWQSGSLSSQSATEEYFVCVCVQAAGLAGMITRSQTPLVSSAFHQRVFFFWANFNWLPAPDTLMSEHNQEVLFSVCYAVLQQPNADSQADWWEYEYFLTLIFILFSIWVPFHPMLKRFWQHFYDKGQFLWAMPMRFIGPFSEEQDLKMGA